VQRAFRILGLFELSKLGLSKESDLYLDNYYNKYEAGKGEKMRQLPLTYIIKTGTRVIFFKEHIEELKDLKKTELFKRVYQVYKFNTTSSDYIYLQNHMDAREDKELGSGAKAIDFSTYQPRVSLTASNFLAALEGRDFEINLDGEIIWR
jgi:hypothetical protein